MTRAQFDNHFYSIPGAWTGSGPMRGTAFITVDAAQAGAAIEYLTGYGFKIVGARPSPSQAGGTQLRVR